VAFTLVTALMGRVCKTAPLTLKHQGTARQGHFRCTSARDLPRSVENCRDPVRRSEARSTSAEVREVCRVEYSRNVQQPSDQHGPHAASTSL
jgi:hypothetical protein